MKATSHYANRMIFFILLLHPHLIVLVSSNDTYLRYIPYMQTLNAYGGAHYTDLLSFRVMTLIS